jgi:hypothetical protein
VLLYVALLGAVSIPRHVAPAARDRGDVSGGMRNR